MAGRNPRRRLRFGIQDRLVLWLLLFGIIPVIGTALFGHWIMGRAATRAAGSRLSAVAEQLSSGVDAELRHLVQAIGGLDPSPTRLGRFIEADTRRAGLDSAALALELTDIGRAWTADSAGRTARLLGDPLSLELRSMRDRNPGAYDHLTVADARGVIIAATRPVARPVVRDEEWWRTAWNRGRGSAYVGRLLRTGGNYVISVALPVKNRDGQAVGVFQVVADLADLAELIEDVSLGATGIATVASSYGDVLISSPTETARAPVVTSDRRRHLASDVPTVYPGRGLHGRDAIIAVAPVRATGGRSRASFGGANWIVTVEENKAEILNATHQFGRYAVVIVLLIAAAVMVVGLLLSERIARPLLDLRDGARRIGAGQLDLRLDLATGDEIEELAGEFNAMTARLRDSYRGLEDRVRTATSELSRERNSLQAIVAALGEGLMVIDPERHIVIWNRAAERMTGFRAEEVIGQHCGVILRTEDGTHPRVCREGCPALAAIESNRTVTSTDMSTRITRQDGHRLPVTYTASPLVDDDGRARGCVIVLRDVTREKEIDRLKSEMISTVSHELRAPLTPIIGFAEMLEDSGLPDEKRRQYTRIIAREGRRLERLVDDFLTLSHIEAGRFELQIEDVDLRTVVADIFTVEAGHNPHHRLRCDIPAGFPTVRADRERVKRALYNLVSNAIKYSPGGGPVVVSADDRDAVVEISVRDEGIGIRPEDLDKLFHRFQRVNRADCPDVRGTGLGLSITAGIVREHGGDIWVDSVHGKGSTFTIRLPRSGPAA